MGQRLINLAPSEFFHVYNRGTEKRNIYLDHTDHERFMQLLYVCNTKNPISLRDIKKYHQSVYDFDRGEPLVSIGAYCLMPNHFHILLMTEIENGISDFMNKVSTGYSIYFNKRYERTGALFQGKFKAQHADSDEYLKYLYSYIHLNPTKLIDPHWKEKGINDAQKSFDFCASFPYSSLVDYLKVDYRDESKILAPEAFPEYFSGLTDIKRELFEWLNYQNDLSRGLSSG